ncbi:MAG: hypothetical protein IT583_02720 [Verrucomicrobia bacterium]|nr:hypothetical protein [Verrucomicrobiota bacterium]
MKDEDGFWAKRFLAKPPPRKATKPSGKRPPKAEAGAIATARNAMTGNFERNVANDRKRARELKKIGWRVLTV